MTSSTAHGDATEILGSVHRGLAADGAVRFLAVEARALGSEIGRRHGLSVDATRLAAECAVAGLFMSAYIKDSERLTLQVQAERPRFSFHCDVDNDGGVRARFSPTAVRRPEGGRLAGAMLAIKSVHGRERYRGITALDDQSVQDALRDHLADSAQVRAVLRLAAGMDDEGEVRFAGGILVERLPDVASQANLSAEAFAAQFGVLEQRPVGDLLVELAFGHLGGESITLLESRQLRWSCGCTERIEGMLRQLGPTELRSMLEDDGGAEVTCHFCNVPTQVGPDRLAALIEQVEADSTDA